MSRFNLCIKLAVVLQENIILTHLEMEKLYEKIKFQNTGTFKHVGIEDIFSPLQGENVINIIQGSFK